MTESAQDLADLSSPSRAKIRLLRRGDDPESGDRTRPHILLAVDQFPRALGGGERVLLRLANLLPRYGFRVSILTLEVHPESAVFNLPGSAPIYLLPLQRTYDREAIRAAFEVKRFLREQHIALVQTFFESSDLWLGPVAKLLSPAKLIWSRRDMGILRSRKHEIAYRLMAHLPDAVFAVSEQVRQHCIEVDRIPPDRVETVYNGIDFARPEAATQRGGTWSAPVIGTVGNIRRVKGHDVFVRAAAEILPEFPSASFVIAGEVLEEDFYAELKQLIAALGLEEKFHFAGGVSDLPAFLKGADLFVMPSRSEGFSNAIIEAMAAGLPVVATNVGGNAEAVVDGVTGRIVAPCDVGALAGAMREILGNPHRAQAMGTAGRERVAERFTTDAMMKQITTAYKRVLKQT